MSNIQNKIGMGMFKIQEGIDKGKNKVDALRDIAVLNKTIEEISAKKLEKIIEIGLITNQKIRQGTIYDEELLELSNIVSGFDYNLYKNRMEIEEINIKNKGNTCECGNEIGKNVKFCNRCGKKVINVEEERIYITCNNCEVDIANLANYCPCCGIKID